MFELGEKEKEEIKGLLDESDTPNEFMQKLIDYVYIKGYADGRLDLKQKIMNIIDCKEGKEN